jgi:hypothetical protein
MTRAAVRRWRQRLEFGGVLLVCQPMCRDRECSFLVHVRDSVLASCSLPLPLTASRGTNNFHIWWQVYIAKCQKKGKRYGRGIITYYLEDLK